MPSHAHFDTLDLKILAAMQTDPKLSNNEIAERVGSSASSVWRRIKSMEDAGILAGHFLRMSAERLGFQETILVQVSLNHHTDKHTDEFAKLVRGCPEILECYVTTGEGDYLLKVLARDIRSYRQFLQRKLMNQSFIGKVQSQVVMEKVKEEISIPVELVQL